MGLFYQLVLMLLAAGMGWDFSAHPWVCPQANTKLHRTAWMRQ